MLEKCSGVDVSMAKMAISWLQGYYYRVWVGALNPRMYWCFGVYGTTLHQVITSDCRGYWDVKMPDRLRKDVWIQFCNLANVELSKYYSPNIRYELMKILLYLSTLEVQI